MMSLLKWKKNQLDGFQNFIDFFRLYTNVYGASTARTLSIDIALKYCMLQVANCRCFAVSMLLYIIPAQANLWVDKAVIKSA